MSPGVCVCGGVTSTEDRWLGGGPGGLRLLLFPSLRRGFGRWGQAQHPAPVKEGPTLSLLPSPPSRATGKGSSGSCLFLESVRWLGKEVSLVKRDLTVGHCEFEGLRRRERDGPFPSICPRAGPRRSPAGGACARSRGFPPREEGLPKLGAGQRPWRARWPLPQPWRGGWPRAPGREPADSGGRVGVRSRPAPCTQLARGAQAGGV